MKNLFWFTLVVFLACSAQVTADPVIKAKIDIGPWLETSHLSPVKTQEVTLKVEKTPEATIRWYRITPDACTIYKNANLPWDPNPYQWRGFDKIDYSRSEIKAFRNQWEIQPFAKARNLSPLDSCHYLQTDVGSFWFQAEVEKDGHTMATPGLDSVSNKGLSPDVFRVSIREDDTYLGYLTSYYNVPGLFGSVPYQSYNYIGADCADVLLAALHRYNDIPMKRDYNVAMVVNEFPKQTKFAMVNGNPAKNIRWESDVQRGDFIAVRYNGSRQFGHIGALYEDANNNTLLDGDDLILHAGPHALSSSRLEDGAFDGEVVILRPSTL